MPAACSTCGKPKSQTAVVCPHCGAIDANLDPREQGPKLPPGRRLHDLSKAEAAALVGGVGTSRAGWREFFLPAAALRGPLVVLDVVLLVLALPLLLGVGLSLMRRRPGTQLDTPRSTYVEHVILGVLAAVVILVLAGQADLFDEAAPAVAVSVAALLARVGLRAWGQRARDARRE